MAPSAEYKYKETLDIESIGLHGLIIKDFIYRLLWLVVIFNYDHLNDRLTWKLQYINI